MRGNAERDVLWMVPPYFRRIDVRLSADLLATLRQDVLLTAPLEKAGDQGARDWHPRAIETHYDRDLAGIEQT